MGKCKEDVAISTSTRASRYWYWFLRPILQEVGEVGNAFMESEIVEGNDPDAEIDEENI